MDTRKKLRRVGQLMRVQQQSQLDALERDMRAATVPFPDELIERLVFHAVGQSERFLRIHPGYRIAKKYEAYGQCYQLFTHCFAHLEKALSAYASFIQREDSLYRTSDPVKQGLETDVLKEFFSLSNAAHALQDQSTRRMMEVCASCDVSNALVTHFGDDNLHDFIVGIRGLIHHVHLLRPEAQTTIKFEPKSIKTSFYISREDFEWLMQHYPKSISAKAKTYLSNCSDKIFIDELYRDYVARASCFHAWFSEHIAHNKPIEVSDFERCALLKKQIVQRVHWRSLIDNWLQWDVPPNPYNHIHRYLDFDEINDIEAMEYGTREQIDRLIEMVDVDGACDAELRKMIYNWFDKAIQRSR